MTWKYFIKLRNQEDQTKKVTRLEIVKKLDTQVLTEPPSGFSCFYMKNIFYRPLREVQSMD